MAWALDHFTIEDNNSTYRVRCLSFQCFTVTRCNGSQPVASVLLYEVSSRPLETGHHRCSRTCKENKERAGTPDRGSRTGPTRISDDFQGNPHIRGLEFGSFFP